MNSFKSFFTKTYVKVISAVLLFLIFTGVLTFAVEWPYESIYSNGNNYNIAFVGASELTRGVDTGVIDKNTGKKSYILATARCPFNGKYEMLKSALDQDSIETVIIEVSIFALSEKHDDYKIEDRVLYFPRLSGLANKAGAAQRNFSFTGDEYDQLYAEIIFEGMDAWKEIAKGTYKEYAGRKGFSPYGAHSQELSAEEAASTYNTRSMSYKNAPENVEIINSMLDLCSEKGVDVILVTMPISQKFVWQNTGLDDFHDIVSAMANEHGVAYYDFNLMKDLSSYLTDAKSYHDEEHLAKGAANEFGNILSEMILSLKDGNSFDYEFYDSYEEAKINSVYAKFTD